MTTHKEALKLALEALEDNQHLVADNERHAYVMEYNDLIEKCKEALAQPEHEPVATDWERIARVQNAKLMAMCNEVGGFEKLREVMDKYEQTTPPQRKPMTDEQRLIEMVDAAMVATRDIVPRITRSQCRLIIEAARSIKGEA